jgi:integrase
MAYLNAIRRACKKAGVPHWHPHSLRHTAASEFRRQFGEETTRVLLGHAKIGTTALYGEVDQAKASDAASKIG